MGREGVCIGVSQHRTSGTEETGVREAGSAWAGTERHWSATAPSEEETDRAGSAVTRKTSDLGPTLCSITNSLGCLRLTRSVSILICKTKRLEYSSEAPSNTDSESL